MTEYPAVGQPLELRDLDGISHLSRVEGIDAPGLAVARPGDLRIGEVFSEGSEFTAVWAVAGGIYSMEVQLLGTRTDGSIRLWDMAICSAVEKQQRRSYVRVPVTGHVTAYFDEPKPTASVVDISSLAAQSHDESLDDESPDDEPTDDEPTDDEPTDDDDPLLLTGKLLDISEAALAAEFRIRREDPRMAIGTALTARFVLHDDEFVVRATILNATLGSTTRDVRVVVLFEHSDAEADSIRQHVFAIQREIHRANRDG